MSVRAVLVSVGWDGFGLSNQMWAVVIILVAATIGTVTMIRNRDVAYGLVLLWAFTGIVIKHTFADGSEGRYPEVIATTLACVVVFVVVEFLVWRRLQRRVDTPGRSGLIVKN